ncbi:MAG: calcium-binding protein [Pseudomonadota bacterium]
MRLLCVLSIALPGWAAADDFNVAPGDSAGLIWAINTANGNGEDDNIFLSAGVYHLDAQDNAISGGPNALPAITSNVSIYGADLASDGSVTTSIVVTPPGFEDLRAFYIDSAGFLDLANLQLEGGRQESSFDANCFDPCGSLILNDGGNLGLKHARVENAGITELGGAIYNNGQLLVEDSTFANNRVLTSGGGVYNAPGGFFASFRSLFVGNQGDERGGGLGNDGLAVIVHSTFSDNSNLDRAEGAGIANGFSGELVMFFSTLAENHGLGIKNTGNAGSVSSIIAGNFEDDGTDPGDCDGELGSGGYNLVGTTSVGALAGVCNLLALATDLVGGSTPIDPRLRPLADNSMGLGAPWSHSLRGNSPARNVIPIENCDVPLTNVTSADQRGFARVFDCDIGAHEQGGVPECVGFTATIYGTAGDDSLRGTAGIDIIQGLGGNDKINGLQSFDLICGGPGDDKLRGSAGDDSLHGEAGNDTLIGSGGDDTMFGDSGNDSLQGKGGNDDLFGGIGDDQLLGQSGDGDMCNGGPSGPFGDATDGNCETEINIP